jgi:LPS sulfotransferase NodH
MPQEPRAPSRRFLILGLPRSGTTYLMTLLNSHSQVYCAGEQFNPYAIVGTGSEKDKEKPALVTRDRYPRRFLNAFFERCEAEGHARVGFKFMIGHNTRILKSIPSLQDISLIYVHRANKLAQVSSWLKAVDSRKWAQTHADEHLEKKLRIGPFKISEKWHEYEAMDFLFSAWFDRLPHHKIKVEYRDMFVDDFNDRICEFLGISPEKGMRSPLVKQGQNDILERFNNPEPIRNYFSKLGYDAWLEPEI